MVNGRGGAMAMVALAEARPLGVRNTTEIDEVIHVGDGFSIVEIKPQYREESPATPDPL